MAAEQGVLTTGKFVIPAAHSIAFTYFPLGRPDAIER
jgi:hypothetical protein